MGTASPDHRAVVAGILSLRRAPVEFVSTNAAKIIPSVPTPSCYRVPALDLHLKTHPFWMLLRCSTVFYGVCYS